MKRTIAVYCLLLASIALSANANTVEANRVVEIKFESTKTYANPFTEIEFDAIVTQPDSTELRVPGFWAGDTRWCFRYASGQIGKHTWRTECTDKKNGQLHGVKGEITVIRYTGANPLYRHGPVHVAANQRTFSHADGTPFFWLGDTWWKGLCKRLTWEGFQELTADRKKKGFNVVQIVCGTYPDELGLLRPTWANEGGIPYLKEDFSVVNPEYFEYADRRFEHMMDAGIVPAIVGGWGRAVNLNSVGLEGYERDARNLIARYGAYPVVWILGGETKKSQGPWYAVAEYIDANDPYNRMLTNHSSTRREALEDHVVLDFDMDATGHRGWETVNNAIQKIIDYQDATPIKPVLTGEACYEQHMQGNFADLQRHLFWGCILSGAAGHTYGAAGIWHMGTPETHGNYSAHPHRQPYDFTTWREGMTFIGSTQLGRGKALLEEYPWHRFEPHPEWHGEGNPKKRLKEYEGFVNEGRFAAGIPGEVIFIYQPKR
ncbi:MAG: apiosidase-like domain-containing protein, partial [Planctomycetota bacterium]